jgi:hypothetical protein
MKSFRHAYGPAAYAEFWRLWAQMAMIGWEAQAVIAMRLLGMGGVWSVTPSENTRMVTEKAAAFTTAAMQGALAAAQGKRPDEIAQTMLRPIRRKTRSNSRRLARRGPKTPSRRD